MYDTSRLVGTARSLGTRDTIIPFVTAKRMDKYSIGSSSMGGDLNVGEKRDEIENHYEAHCLSDKNINKVRFQR